MKTYVKPDLYFENFELAQHIATSCNVRMTNLSHVEDCVSDVSADILTNYLTQLGIKTHGTAGVIFGSTNQNCDTDVDDFCYTNGSNHYFIVFNS